MRNHAVKRTLDVLNVFKLKSGRVYLYFVTFACQLKHNSCVNPRVNFQRNLAGAYVAQQHCGLALCVQELNFEEAGPPTVNVLRFETPKQRENGLPGTCKLQKSILIELRAFIPVARHLRLFDLRMSVVPIKVKHCDGQLESGAALFESFRRTEHSDELLGDVN